MALQSGHKVVKLNESEQKTYDGHFNGIMKSYFKLIPNNWFLSERYEIFADKIYNFKFKESDILLMTFPKCGTTWVQEILWTMRNNPNLSHPKANIHPNIRAPFIEADMIREIKIEDAGETTNEIVKEFLELCPGKDPKDGVYLQMAEFTKEPRTLKTHLPFPLLTPSLLDSAKVVYVIRNPKDVVVSMCHHMRIMKVASFNGTLEDYAQLFMDDKVVFAPYHQHVKEAWEKKNHPNLHFIFYEEMKANPLGEIQRLDAFLGTHLTAKQLENIVKYTSFNEMKARDSKSRDPSYMNQEIVQKEGGFYRKGEAGDWKNKFTPELESKLDEWIEKNFTSFGFTFK